jgi:hypothetical protein
MVLLVSSVGMAWAGGSHHHGHESAYWWARGAGVALGAVSGVMIGAGTGGAACGAAMRVGTGLATGVVLRTVGACQTGRERPQRDDHASTAWMSASAHQGPGTPAR